MTSLAAAAAVTLSLSACSPTHDPAPSTPTPTAQAWPRTIDIPAQHGGETSTLTIEAEPQHIAALDYESAEVLAELGLANPAVSSLPAFAAGRVLRIEGKQVQSLGLTATVDGTHTLTDWVTTLR